MKWAPWLIVPGLIVFVGAALISGYRADRAAAQPFSADEQLARALPAAQKLAADAELSTLSATLVDPDGRVQAALGGMIVAYFRSPSRVTAAAQPAVLGAPVRAQPYCPRIRVAAHMRRGNTARHFDFDSGWSDPPECLDSLPEPAKCSVAAIWRRALSDGAPHPAFADLRLEPHGRARRWTFEITDHAKEQTVFRKSYPDDCR
jgi:hypothetical protein